MPCLKIICAFLLVIIIATICKYQQTKNGFIDGMWSNNNEDIFMYIDNQKSKDSWRGGYLVSTKLDINEPFKLKTDIGVMDDLKITTKKSKFLNKNMTSKLNMDKGMIEITSKDGKKFTLYKDTQTSSEMKKIK